VTDQFLAGRRALVSGGASGIGREIAIGLARAGSDVAIGSLLNTNSTNDYEHDNTYLPGADELKRTEEELKNLGGKVIALPLDVRDDASVQTIFNAATDRFGGVDILVNAAGTDVDQPMPHHPDETWHRVIDTNLNGNFRTIKRCLPGMIERGWGRIVIIGSTAGNVGYAAHAAYCASKSGLLGLMRCVALEGAPHGITCNVISPGTVETGMSRTSFKRKSALSEGTLKVEEVRARAIAAQPQGRFLLPSEIASMALYLCREEARGLTMENITVSGAALW